MSATPPLPPPPPPGDDQGAGASPQQPGAGQEVEGGPFLQPSGLSHRPTSPRRNSMAMTALVLGLIAFPGVVVIAFTPLASELTILTPLAAIAAIIIGIVGIRRAKRPSVRGGVAMSVTGMILGLINILGALALVVGVVQFPQACPGSDSCPIPEACPGSDACPRLTDASARGPTPVAG